MDYQMPDVERPTECNCVSCLERRASEAGILAYALEISRARESARFRGLAAWRVELNAATTAAAEYEMWAAADPEGFVPWCDCLNCRNIMAAHVCTTNIQRVLLTARITRAENGIARAESGQEEEEEEEEEEIEEEEPSFICSVCREVESESESHYTADGRVCISCFSDYRECYGCEAMVHYENTRERNEEYYCSQCYDNINTNRVHSYSYSPERYRMYGEGPLFHGIELEVGWLVGDKEEYAESVCDALGEEYAYLKEDGSISSANVRDGFEIVTHPASVQECAKRLKPICDKGIPGLLSHDGGGGLGLHISVNRNALSNHSIARVCVFVGGERNKTWIVKLARRTSTRWGEIIPKTGVEDTLQIMDGREYLKVNENRYEAINLQNSSHIEFRLFRGTLKYSSLMTCIEFVNALCIWCMQKADVADYQNSKVFLAFVEERGNLYPHLLKFMRANVT